MNMLTIFTKIIFKKIQCYFFKWQSNFEDYLIMISFVELVRKRNNKQLLHNLTFFQENLNYLESNYLSFKTIC